MLHLQRVITLQMPDIALFQFLVTKYLLIGNRCQLNYFLLQLFNFYLVGESFSTECIFQIFFKKLEAFKLFKL